jgi:transcriptional regulator with XRE-family HTH domain
VIGKRLIELRNKNKMTQKEVAAKLKISRSAYSNYESNFREPDFKNVELLADIFEVSVDYLLGRETKESSIEESELDEERNRLANIIVNINDPEKKKQAIAFLEYLANSPTDGAKK